MLHDLRPGLLAVSVAACWTVAGAAAACVPAPPTTPEKEAARLLSYQQDRWERAQSVFLAQATSEGRSAPDSPFRIWKELTPVLQLKGPPVTKALRIEQTGMSSCGPLPSLDVLYQKSGGYYLVYSTSKTPEQEAIIATLRVGDLVDPQAIAAWRAAAAPAR